MMKSSRAASRSQQSQQSQRSQRSQQSQHSQGLQYGDNIRPAPAIQTLSTRTSARKTYLPGKDRWNSNGQRAQTAGSARSGMSSVIDGARDILGKATNVLEARPQTAKTTKTILSHRNRWGWSSTLRDGDIVKHAGRGLPKRVGYDLEVDHATGELRCKAVKARPATALGLRQPSCRRAPGYKAPQEDYGPNPPGEGSDDPSFYVRPEDLDIANPGHR